MNTPTAASPDTRHSRRLVAGVLALLMLALVSGFFTGRTYQMLSSEAVPLAPGSDRHPSADDDASVRRAAGAYMGQLLSQVEIIANRDGRANVRVSLVDTTCSVQMARQRALTAQAWASDNGWIVEKVDCGVTPSRGE